MKRFTVEHVATMQRNTLQQLMDTLYIANTLKIMAALRHI